MFLLSSKVFLANLSAIFARPPLRALRGAGSPRFRTPVHTPPQQFAVVLALTTGAHRVSTARRAIAYSALEALTLVCTRRPMLALAQGQVLALLLSMLLMPTAADGQAPTNHVLNTSHPYWIISTSTSCHPNKGLLFGSDCCSKDGPGCCTLGEGALRVSSFDYVNPRTTMAIWLWPVQVPLNRPEHRPTGEKNLFYLVGAKDSFQAGQVAFGYWATDRFDHEAPSGTQWEFISTVPSHTDATTEDFGTSVTHYYIVLRTTNESLYVTCDGAALRPALWPPPPPAAANTPQHPARASQEGSKRGSWTLMTTWPLGSCCLSRATTDSANCPGTRRTGRPEGLRGSSASPPHFGSRLLPGVAGSSSCSSQSSTSIGCPIV